MSADLLLHFPRRRVKSYGASGRFLPKVSPVRKAGGSLVPNGVVQPHGSTAPTIPTQPALLDTGNPGPIFTAARGMATISTPILIGFDG